MDKSPLVQLTLARVREFYRQPEAVFWVYGFPLIMIVALGIAFRNRPVDQVTVDIVEGPLASQIREKLDQDELFDIYVDDEAACRERLRTGRTDVVVTASGALSNGFSYAYDPTRPGSLLARERVNSALQISVQELELLPTTDEELDEPGGRYIDFLVPGLLGMSLMGGGIWGVGFVTVDMRIRKLLKRFVATPMRRSEFLASLMCSRMIFMIPEVVLVVVFARFAFGVVNFGSWFDIIVLVLIGAVMFSGIGLLLAVRASTLETISGLINLAMLPMWILSGIFFSTDRFPEFLQPWLRALPLTPLIDALRGVMLEAETLADLGPELGIMSIWTVGSFALALKFFKWN